MAFSPLTDFLIQIKPFSHYPGFDFRNSEVERVAFGRIWLLTLNVLLYQV